MKLRKNLEGVFLVAVAVTFVASYATAQIPQLLGGSPQPVAAKLDVPMSVVVVTAKRLTAAEKAAMD